MRMNKRTAWALAAGVAALSLLFPPALAKEAELEKVREMLRLDTERALAAERSRQGAAGRGAPAAPARRGDKLVLASVYGLRGALTAVVLVNGEPRVYRQGRDLPRGATSSNAEYRLQRIEDGCVYLRKGSAGERSACFDPSASLPRPPVAGSPVAAPISPPPAFPVLAPPPVMRP
ncbi:hypothetical protein CDO44_26800 [Pigmentiphaga sp. NML080357]|nr:hypothetical protein CDO44_26800 [Pigmentiphaga sp. NML080357]